MPEKEWRRRARISRQPLASNDRPQRVPRVDAQARCLVPPLRELLSGVVARRRRSGNPRDGSGQRIDLEIGVVSDRVSRHAPALAPLGERFGIARVTVLANQPSNSLRRSCICRVEVEIAPVSFLQPTLRGELFCRRRAGHDERRGRIVDLFAGCGTSPCRCDGARVHAVDSDAASIAALLAAARKAQKLKPVTAEVAISSAPSVHRADRYDAADSTPRVPEPPRLPKRSPRRN